MAPPQLADRSFQRDAVRAVVVEARQAAVDLARRVDEAAPLGEGDHLFHEGFAGDGHGWDLAVSRGFGVERARRSPPAPSGRRLDLMRASPPRRGGEFFPLRAAPPRWGGEFFPFPSGLRGGLSYLDRTVARGLGSRQLGGPLPRQVEDDLI